MAKVIPYLIRTFRGGVSDENDKGLPGAHKYGHGLDIHSRDDVLQSEQAMSTVFDINNTTLTSGFNFIVPASDGSTYFFGATGSVFARSSDGFWTNVYNDNEAIIGAAQQELSTGESYLFWGKQTSIARRQIALGNDPARDSGQAIWTDATQVWKTEFIHSGVSWRPMTVASGSLLIGNGDGLAMNDFDGNFDPKRMNIRPGNLVNDIEERDDFAILASERNTDEEEGHIWSWITTAISWVQKKRLPIKGVNALITTELPLAQGGEAGEIFASDFTNIAPLAILPGGGKVNPGGTTIVDDLAAFGFYGGTYPGIWTYGRRHKNRSLALNYQWRLVPTIAGSLVSTIYSIETINGLLYASWGVTDGSTSEYGVDSVNTTTKATALYEGLEFDAGEPHLQKTFLTRRIIFAPLPSGTSLSAKFKLDKEADWRYAVLGNGGTTFSAEMGSTIAIFSIHKAGRVYESGLEINPRENNTPQILSDVTYIEPPGDEYAGK